jgi:hypothetical protein
VVVGQAPNAAAGSVHDRAAMPAASAAAPMAKPSPRCPAQGYPSPRLGNRGGTGAPRSIEARPTSAVQTARAASSIATSARLGRSAPAQIEACVFSMGAIGVFPSSGGKTCGRLGLAPLPASYAGQAKRFAELREAIVAQLGEPASGSSRRGPQCVHESAARALVRRELNAHGYRDWRIQTAGGRFSAQRPCAGPSFDTGGKVVLLTPAVP